MKDEDAVHGLFDRRDHFVFFSRHAEGHAQEVAGVGQVVVRIEERLPHRILVGHGRDGRHLGDQAVAGDLALHRIRNVGGIVVKCRERANHAAHHGHRVRITAEAAVEAAQLLMHHGVASDGVGELVELRLAGQFAIQQQVADFHEAGMFCQLADRIAAVQQDAFVTVDVGQRAFARGRRGEAGIIGEHPRLAIELADVDDIRPDAARKDGIFRFARTGAEFNRIAHLSYLLKLCLHRPRPGHRSGPDFLPGRAGPERQKYLGKSFARLARP